MKFKEIGRNGRPVRTEYREITRGGDWVHPDGTGYGKDGNNIYRSGPIPRKPDGSSAIPKQYDTHGRQITNDGVFSDKALTCSSCGEVFTWSAGEQAYFAKKRLNDPRRCPSCRHK